MERAYGKQHWRLVAGLTANRLRADRLVDHWQNAGRRPRSNVRSRRVRGEEQAGFGAEWWGTRVCRQTRWTTGWQKTYLLSEVVILGR